VSYATDRLEFISRIYNETTDGDWTQYVARRYAIEMIVRATQTHHRYCEAYCNVEGFDPARIDQIERRIIKRATQIGAGVVFSRDPRGATVKLTVPSGYTDDGGREGICVPTRY